MLLEDGLAEWEDYQASPMLHAARPGPVRPQRQPQHRRSPTSRLNDVPTDARGDPRERVELLARTQRTPSSNATGLNWSARANFKSVRRFGSRPPAHTR